MRLIKPFFALSSVLVLIFSPISFSNIVTYSQTSEDEEISGYQEWTQDRTVSGNVKINSGATLVVKNGVTITFDRAYVNIEGTMVVSGTVKNPVTLKKADRWNYYMKVGSNGRLIIRNTDISGSGFGPNTVYDNKSIFNKALANPYVLGGINVGNGWLDVESSSFHDNNIAIVVDNTNVERVKVNRSKFFNNKNYDVYYSGLNAAGLDFKYNWWGSPDGPDDYKFEQIINTDNWLDQENFQDPVVIIPGIMGSMDFMGEKKLDPIFRTYAKLENTFEKNGYIKGKSFFIFPYEWRNSNIDNAVLLKQKINEIKQLRNWPKVDIVAHSMGGLLTREYIESGNYQNDIDQLVTLGTPQTGSPEDYLAWEGGKIATSKFNIIDMFVEDIFKAEANEKGFPDIFNYIHNRPINSVEELLPNYSYLFDVEDNNLRIYPQNYPENTFLDNLNSEANLSKLNYVEFDNIIGNLDDPESTISQINVIESSKKPLWNDGYPENFDSLFGDHGLEYGEGDGTVPFESANALKADEKVTLDAQHRELASEGADIAFDLLNNKQPEHQSNLKIIRNILVFFVFSPIDIQVIAPPDENGVRKRVGKDFDHPGKILDEIEGAYYTGYDGIDSEFLTIPDPIDGEYTIKTQGTENDVYKIEATKIVEDETTREVAESTGIINGTAILGEIKDRYIEVRGGEVISEKSDTLPPIITLTSPENKDYLNSRTVSVTSSVTDDVSAPENIIQKIFLDGIEIGSLQIDLALQKLGEHSVKVTAEDEAGNKSDKMVEFTVSTDIDAIMANVSHYYDLKLIRNKSTKNILEARLRVMQNLSNNMLMIQNNPWIPQKTRAILAENFQKIINFQIDQIIQVIQKNANILQPAEHLLIESLDSIKL
ncbi:MAG: hypothetical protein WCX17_04510 [Parcubacteria group bacterium]|jgi:pimeloyl-ACP methyl ester carboxylesterase